MNSYTYYDYLETLAAAEETTDTEEQWDGVFRLGDI